MNDGSFVYVINKITSLLKLVFIYSLMLLIDFMLHCSSVTSFPGRVIQYELKYLLVDSDGYTKADTRPPHSKLSHNVLEKELFSFIY